MNILLCYDPKEDSNMKRSDFMLGGIDFKTLIASQMMETNINSIAENTSGRESATIMVDNDMTSLPVVNDKRGLVGVITEYDILRPIEEGKDLETLKAKDIMSKDCQIVSGSTSVVKVLKIFNENRVFKVFVVEDQVLKGVIVKHDVILAYLNATQEPPKGF